MSADDIYIITPARLFKSYYYACMIIVEDIAACAEAMAIYIIIVTAPHCSAFAIIERVTRHIKMPLFYYIILPLLR